MEQNNNGWLEAITQQQATRDPGLFDVQNTTIQSEEQKTFDDSRVQEELDTLNETVQSTATERRQFAEQAAKRNQRMPSIKRILGASGLALLAGAQNVIAPGYTTLREYNNQEGYGQPGESPQTPDVPNPSLFVVPNATYPRMPVTPDPVINLSSAIVQPVPDEQKYVARINATEEVKQKTFDEMTDFEKFTYYSTRELARQHEELKDLDVGAVRALDNFMGTGILGKTIGQIIPQWGAVRAQQIRQLKKNGVPDHLYDEAIKRPLTEFSPDMMAIYQLKAQKMLDDHHHPAAKQLGFIEQQGADIANGILRKMQEEGDRIWEDTKTAAWDMVPGIPWHIQWGAKGLGGAVLLKLINRHTGAPISIDTGIPLLIKMGAALSGIAVSIISQMTKHAKQDMGSSATTEEALDEARTRALAERVIASTIAVNDREATIPSVRMEAALVAWAQGYSEQMRRLDVLKGMDVPNKKAIKKEEAKLQYLFDINTFSSVEEKRKRVFDATEERLEWKRARTKQELEQKGRERGHKITDPYKELGLDETEAKYKEGINLIAEHERNALRIKYNAASVRTPKDIDEYRAQQAREKDIKGREDGKNNSLT